MDIGEIKVPIRIVAMVGDEIVKTFFEKTVRITPVFKNDRSVDLSVIADPNCDLGEIDWK